MLVGSVEVNRRPRGSVRETQTIQDEAVESSNDVLETRIANLAGQGRDLLLGEECQARARDCRWFSRQLDNTSTFECSSPCSSGACGFLQASTGANEQELESMGAYSKHGSVVRQNDVLRPILQHAIDEELAQGHFARRLGAGRKRPGDFWPSYHQRQGRTVYMTRPGLPLTWALRRKMLK